MKTIQKILSIIKPYSVFIVFSLLFAAASVLFTLLIPVLAGDAIDLLVGANQVSFSLLGPKLVYIIVCAVGLALSQWLLGVINNKLVFHTVHDLRAKAFAKITVLPLSYLDANPSGKTVNRMIADADQLADGLLMGFSQLFTGVLTIVGTLVIMFMKSVSVAFVVVLVTPLSLFAASFIAKRVYKYFTEQTKTRSEQTAVIDEMIGEKKTVTALGLEQEAIAVFDASNEAYRRANLLATFYSSIINPTTRFVNNLVYAGVCLFGALAVLSDGGFTIGALSAMLAYAIQYTKPFNEISGVVTELQNALACAENIFELIDQPAEPANAAGELSDVAGTVSIEHVSFSYDKTKPLIENLNVQAAAGQRVAIVGPTGCGKTTIINLLMRFYDIDEGRILVDGIDVRDVTRQSLRRSYGMVLQETWLKAGTIRENIMFGKPDATEQEVVAAAKAAHAHSFIKRLSNGYDTKIGEDGGSLSQGQKQLLCIARVMLSLPPMLILDEATSSIDTRTEIKIQKAFATMMEGRTSFVVAHRLSTIKNADIILVMKDGHIIESGSHQELLEKGGFYHHLYHSQFAKA
ncbi:MAG: ABC transporter ATP-binding protein [Clostridiales bacterium]|nr:ABC transporter ATP-binding protein [Clostridiales bacterium]